MEQKDVNHNLEDFRNINEFVIFKQEVDAWLTDNHFERHESTVYDFLDRLYTGTFEAVSFDNLNSMNLTPEWLDIDKLEAGQKFAKDFYLTIATSEVITLVMGLCNDTVLNKLIFTGRSSCLYTSFKRYLSTGKRVRCWMTQDLLNSKSEASRNIKTVNSMHRHFYEAYASTDPEDLDRLLKLTDVKSTVCPFVAKDMLKRSRRFNFSGRAKPRHPLTQTEMLATQFSFLGLLISEPVKFGVCPIRYRDGLEGFVHLWKYIGYRLGVAEVYNFCSGTYDQVLVKSKVFIDFVIKKNLHDVDARWEHMTRCVIEGMQYTRRTFSYETYLLFGFYVLDLNCDELYSRCSAGQKLEFFIMKNVYYYLMPYQPFRVRITEKILKEIDKVANNLPSEEEFYKKIGINHESYKKNGIKEEYVKNIGIKEEYSKNTEIKEECSKNTEIKEEYSKNTEIKGEFRKDAEIIEENSKNIGVNEECSKNVEIKEEYPKNIEIIEENPENIRVNEEYSNNIEIKEEYPKNIAIKEECPKNIEIIEENSTNIGVNEEYLKKMVITEECVKRIEINKEHPQKIITTASYNKEDEFTDSQIKLNEIDRRISFKYENYYMMQ